MIEITRHTLIDIVIKFYTNIEKSCNNQGKNFNEFSLCAKLNEPVRFKFDQNGFKASAYRCNQNIYTFCFNVSGV